MAVPLLTLKDMELSFGAKEIFTSLSFSINPGEAICLVGRNGSGKSTLLKVLADFIQPDKGTIFKQPGLRLTYCPQEPDFTGHETLHDYCMGGLGTHQQTESYRVEALYSQMNFDPRRSPLQASGGERRRAAMVRAFATMPDIMLLDEPTNHLDLHGILWLEEQLRSFTGAYILISHDRRFLTNLSKVTLWLDRGQVRRLNKGYAHFEEWAETLLDQEMREQQKLAKVISQETRWSHQGISARRKRNQGRLRRLYELRAKKADHIAQTGRVRLSLKEDETPSQLVIEAKDVSKSLGGTLLFKGFSTRILSGERLGVVGPNGCGKSTLIKMMLGEIAPDTGHLRQGKNLRALYFDQQRETLDLSQTLWETLAVRGTDQVMVQGKPRHVVGYLKDFLFDPEQARSPVASLSGGEKSRLLLAKYFAKTSNFLILDEPTNDLDMDTLDLLTDVLSDFEGTVIIISHDRDFLDQLVTSTLVFTPTQQLIEVAGGYTEAMAYINTYYNVETIGSVRQPKHKENAPHKKLSKALSRLSYHETRLLEILPQEISALEKRLQELAILLEDTELYQKDAAQFHGLTSECQALQKSLEDKENQWLELEHKRETLPS